MAQSFSHKWGQIIGDLIEGTILELLQAVADEFKLYLDYKKPRKARPGKKVAWKDRYGNTHDLDYVLERGGTETAVGVPAAFVEIAWRRYTKHSRNKAQELEGAVVPLADTYSHLHPFLGIVLAGVFTKGSINQLRSRGFSLVYFPYESVLKAFSLVGIDASFDEDTIDGLTMSASSQAVIYARVSSKEQKEEGFSIPAQLKLLCEYAERKEFHRVREFTDFEEMVAFLKQHPHIKIIRNKQSPFNL